MTTFDKREEGFEKQFAHDEELKFKATARRNKLIGLWLAQLLGLGEAEAKPYADALVAGEVGADADGLFKTAQTRLAHGGVEMSDNRLRRRIDEAAAQARAEIMAGR